MRSMLQSPDSNSQLLIFLFYANFYTLQKYWKQWFLEPIAFNSFQISIQSKLVLQELTIYVGNCNKN